MNTRLLGAEQERKAAAFLEEHGVEILERNYRVRSGEIDLIGRDENYLIFFEVKFRSTGKLGEPMLSVTNKKQKKIMETAKHYLYEKHIRTDTALRFDCISMLGDQISWIKNAFQGGT